MRPALATSTLLPGQVSWSGVLAALALTAVAILLLGLWVFKWWEEPPE